MKLQSILLPIFTLLGTLNIFANEKPNIVFILADDFGVMDTSYAGSSLYSTPNIDRLASEGISFHSAYCSHPRCVPSRYAIFSGRIPGRDGVPGFQNKKESKHTLPLSRTTWAEILVESGYSTGYIGKWHLGKDGGEPDKQGFQDSRIANAAGAPNSYFFPYHISKSGSSKEEFPIIEGAKGEYLTDRLTDEAVDFIEKNQSVPFALVLAHYAVHTPIEAPQKTVRIYQEKLTKSGEPISDGKNDLDFILQGNGQTKTKHNNPVYAAMIDHMDHSVGKVLAKLEALGLSDNTIVILTSDHGGLSTRSKDKMRHIATSNSPYRAGKGWLYDGGLKVPLIVRWPSKITKGISSEDRVTGIDHFQTILDLTGCQIPPECEIDGISYRPALFGKKLPKRDLFFHSPLGRPLSTGDHSASALVKDDWKLIKIHHTGDYELYNLKTDPSESKNLSNKRKKRFELMKAAFLQQSKDLAVKQREHPKP